jgi:hypothetical protein
MDAAQLVKANSIEGMLRACIVRTRSDSAASVKATRRIILQSVEIAGNCAFLC